MSECWDVIVVGGGPAGLSAALVLGRSLRRTLIVDSREPRNAPSHALHGFLTRDGIDPHEFRRSAAEELARYGVQMRADTVVDAAVCDVGFSVKLEDGTELRSRKLLLATGVRDVLPEIEGLAERFGDSVLHCPYCDGWEAKGRKLGVYGEGDAGVAFAVQVAHWSPDVIFTPPDPEALSKAHRRDLAAARIEIAPEPVVRLEGPGTRLEHLVLRSGRQIAREALFFKAGCVLASDLAQRLGCKQDGASVRADPSGTTCVPGVYVAGDMSPQPKLAIVAAAEGMQAAMELHSEMRREDVDPRRVSRAG